MIASETCGKFIGTLNSERNFTGLLQMWPLKY
uniref:Uncharacterized protein n=1 Tax=Rhizophora mucronata TaxID=61149 RepID=A0A2P2IRG0_RHIMU